MIVIGVTGNIGTGKSTVCRILSGYGAAVIDADRLGHEVYKPHTPGWQEVVDLFGKAIIKDNDEIDRKKLGDIVFASPTALKRLNSIVHPKINDAVHEAIESYRKNGVQVTVLEATLLIEAGWHSLVDSIWLIMTSQDIVVNRLAARGYSEEEVLSRLRTQMPEEHKKRYADICISNNGDLAQLEAAVKASWQHVIQ